ncbi:FecR domain-containing protein [Larkinella humicola]|uniref:FecR domain-containing protein n=1 Tax=Larkinella humicola TaxID=2607654 RepID=A0A5N1JEB5_9BACT|nr:FecR family protein [Larkinella humicola]KAA9353716.1 FecR domain-containing protein [Larkinella humicola]
MEELLVKYVRNECSPEEEQWVIGWLQNPDNESRLRGLMRKQWSNPSVSGVESPDWQQMWMGIARQTKDLPIESEPPLYRTVWRQIARIAIWIGCIIAFGLGIRFLREAQLPADVIYQSGADQSMRVELTDHSSVILNKNSTLTVSSDWSGPNRSIWLDGEAIVDVAEQPIGFRLLIHTADHVVTEAQKARIFVARKDKKVRVVVEQGLANFVIHYSGMLGEMKKYTLQRGGMAEYDEKSTQLIRRQVNPLTYTSWAQPH